MGAPLVADAAAVGACGGDVPQQRLLTRTACGVDHVVHGTGLVGVQFVDHGEVDVQAVERAAFGSQRGVLAGRGRHGDAVLQHDYAQVGAQVGHAVGHGFAVVKDDARLVARGGCAVHLGALLPVGTEHVQGQAAGEGGLGVFARHFHIPFPKAAQPCFVVYPTEDGGEDEALPVFQLDQSPLTRPLALDVGQQLDEPAGALGQFWVEHVGPVGRQGALQILALALDGQLGPLAGGHSAAGHRSHVTLGSFNVSVGHGCQLSNGAPESPGAN